MTRPTRTVGSPDATRAVDWEQRRLPAAAQGAPGSREGGARGIGSRGRAPLRPEQHPLRHEHAHRRVGARQERALHAARARRGADPLGLRVGRSPPPAVRALAPPGELPRWCLAHARRHAGRDRHSGQAWPRRSRTSCAGSASRTSRSASTWRISSRSRRSSAPASGSPTAPRCSSRRARSRPLRRSCCSTSRPGSSTPSTRTSTGCCVRACTSTRSSRARTSSSSRWGRSRSRPSTPCRATAATRIRTCSRIGSCGRATRRSSTSSIRSWDTERATTARSTSAASTTRSSMRTSSAASGSTRRSRSFDPA